MIEIILDSMPAAAPCPMSKNELEAHDERFTINHGIGVQDVDVQAIIIRRERWVRDGDDIGQAGRSGSRPGF